jgi:hypothetical protein
MKKIFEKVFGAAIFTIRLPKKDESLLWWVDDGDFVYTHFLQFGKVEKKEPGVKGIDLILGPLKFSLAWLPKRKAP